MSGPIKSKCRSCGAEIFWAKWESGKMTPVDAVACQPSSKANLVLTLRGGLLRQTELICEHFDSQKHDEKRNRYTTHFATCPNAAKHRVSK